ncbi:MAG: histidinol-phosphate transaminase [Moraxellaceae bacterium]|nr:histidinol-phosphate transaminase [Moraxellaceae bacterium]
MSTLWSPFVHDLVPYVPGEQPRIENLVKLNTNEHPYGPSPKALAAMQVALTDDLRLYPDPSSTKLRQAMAARVGLEASQVFVGNGSDEVLAHAFNAFFRQPEAILFPDITYSFYKVYAQLFDIRYELVPLNQDLAIDPADYAKANGGVIFPNPNAPTGCLLPLASIRAVLTANPTRVVIIDEAYIDFGGDSAVSLVNEFDNLLVTQTLSKSRALAGLRVGMAFGQRHLIDALERVKDSFNSYPLGRLAQAGAQAAIEDEGYFQSTCDMVIMQRNSLVAQLQRRGFEVLPSAANFVLAKHPAFAGAALCAGLREQAVLVRHFATPRISDYLRITVGTPDQHKALLTALDELLA